MRNNIYKIEYYKEDSRFHWTNTRHDMVSAPTKERAKEKFRKKHPEKEVFTVVNEYHADY